MARILVIDDEEQVCSLFKRILERAGYDVDVALNGNDGLAQFKAKPSDLIITDIVMPEKEGLETIREIRKNHPDVHIIAISGGGQGHTDTYLDLARKLGAGCTLSKPVRREELLATVQSLLGNPNAP